MNDNYNRVLKAFIDEAKNGNITADIFDIRYETNLSFSELQDIIVLLAKNGEVTAIDKRHCEFTGDINRTIEVEEEAEDVSESQADEDSPAKRRAYLEERRRELLRRVQTAADCRDDGDDNYDDEESEESEETDDGYDEIERRRAELEERYRKLTQQKAQHDGKEYPPELKSGICDLANVIKAIADKNKKEQCDREYIDLLGDMAAFTSFHYRWAEDEPGRVFVSYGKLGYKTGGLAEFRVIHYEDTTILSDNGYVFDALCKRDGYGERRAKKQIRQYTKGTVFDFTDDNELRLEVGKPKNFTPFFFLFYWTLEGLL